MMSGHALNPPNPGFPVSASDAFERAGRWLRYGLDCIDADPACQHPQLGTKPIEGHARAALAQHDAITQAIDLSSPEQKT